MRCKALEVFVRRSYRTFGVAKDSKVKVASSAVGVLGARWQFRHPGVSLSGNGSKGMHKWQGSAKVVPDRKALEAFLTTDLNIDTGKEEKANEENGFRLGRLHIFVLGEAAATAASTAPAMGAFVAKVHSMLRSVEAKLKDLGAQEVVLVLQGQPQHWAVVAKLRYACFAERLSWMEVKHLRDLSPSAPCLLEVDRLAEQLQIERLAPVAAESGIAEVFLATFAGANRRSSKVVQVRTVSHMRLGFNPKQGARAACLEGCSLQRCMN